MSAPPAPTPTLDVSRLPAQAFGSVGLMRWGTFLFMLIEGVTLALVAASYLYLRLIAEEWPPFRTPAPPLEIGTINLVVMAASIPVLMWAQRAARRLDLAQLRAAFLVASVFIIAMCILRWSEFHHLDTRWDSHAYGSMIWAILGFHATLLVLEAGEIIGTAALLVSGPVPGKYIVDASDTAVYWYFMVGIWVPLYVLVYLLPRWV